MTFVPEVNNAYRAKDVTVYWLSRFLHLSPATAASLDIRVQVTEGQNPRLMSAAPIGSVNTFSVEA